MAKEIRISIFFFAIAAVIILWQMLLPGYILTLDMVFAPHLNLAAWFAAGNFLNGSPLAYLLEFLNLFLSGWIIQKIIIIALFFSIGYLAYVYLPVPKKNYARYFAALFYLINPFVCERFLAGQWTVLAAYAFLPPFIAALIKFNRQPLLANSLKLFGWLILINIFSLHIFVMSAIVLAGYFVVNLFYNIVGNRPSPSCAAQATPPGEGTVLILAPTSLRGKYSLGKARPGGWLIKFLVGGLVFLVISSYWLAPYFLNQNASVVNSFDQSNWTAFQTAGDKHLGTALNVAALYGFWEEHENWAGYFIWPKDNYVFWLIATLALFILIISGIVWGIKKKRKLAVALLLIGLVGFIFSCGVGDTIFKNLNLFLFNHLSFWRGFRDSEKWTSYLILVYAIFAGWGVIYLNELWEKKGKAGTQSIAFLPKYFVWLLMALAILGTYTELGGFARQLQPVWYPSSWYQAKQIMDQDKSDYRILFLPWHLYFSLNFNRRLITANPAEQFFGTKIIQSGNMDLPGASGDYIDPKFAALDKLISDNNAGPAAVLAALRADKVKYIIYLPDVAGEDQYQYYFINQAAILPILNEKDLTLFTVIEK